MALNIVCHGNSITLGTGGTPYPTQLDTLFGGSHAIFNEGTGAIQTAQLITNFATEVHAHYDAGADDNIVIFWESTNEFYFGETLQNEIDNIIAYCTLARDNGWKVILGNLIRRGNYSALDFDTWNARVDDFNAWLSGNWISLAHGFCDFYGLHVDLQTPFTGVGPVSYYSDEAHLNTAGYALVAAEAKTAIEYAVASGSFQTVTLPDTSKRIIHDYRLAGGSKVAVVYAGSTAYTYKGETPALVPTPATMVGYVSG